MTVPVPGCQINAEAGLSNVDRHFDLVEDSRAGLKRVTGHVFDLPSCRGLDEFSLCWQNGPEAAAPGCHTLPLKWLTSSDCFVDGGVEQSGRDTVGPQQ